MSLFERYRSALTLLPIREKYTLEDLLIPELMLGEDCRLRVYYCPFDWLNMRARVVILGITPGFTQMELAFRGACEAIRNGKTADEICMAAKTHGSFTGPMRKNLVQMLDDIGLPDVLSLRSSSDLFGASRHFLHTASAIRYPVFRGTANYTGQSPTIVRSPLLMQIVRDVLVEELSLVPDAVIIPLGKSVEEVLQTLVNEGLLPSHRWIRGFPHPSGANGYRKSQFDQNREFLSRQLHDALS